MSAGPQALALREAAGSAAAAASTSRFRLVRALDDVAALKLSRYVKKGSPADFCRFFAAGTDTDEVEGELLMQLKQHGWWVTCEDDELPALHKIELSKSGIRNLSSSTLSSVSQQQPCLDVVLSTVWCWSCPGLGLTFSVCLDALPCSW